MADLNEVRLIGRLTRDPELRSTPGGQYVATLGLATGRQFKGQDGVLRDETTFVDITCWGKLAETVSKYMKKGRQIFVGGRLKYESWDDKETNKKRSKISVVAENIQFLDSKRDNEEMPPAMPPAEGGQFTPTMPPGAKEKRTGGAEPATWEEPHINSEEPPF